MEPKTLVILAGVIVVLLLVLYYVFLVRAIVEMVRRRAHTVLTVFSFIALIPVPPLIILGILLMVIWHRLKETMP